MSDEPTYASINISIVHELFRRLLERHPLPWRYDLDWGVDVLDAKGGTVVGCLRTTALADEWIAVANKVHEQLEADRIAYEKFLVENGLADLIDDV
jgi:hypothetical protein